MNSFRKKGFTLIELLVVIAIIALLLAIIVPALRTVKERARRIQCRSNLHNLFIASYTYAQGNNEYFAPTSYIDKNGKEWGNVIATYWAMPTCDILYEDYLGSEMQVFYCKSWMREVKYSREEDYYWDIAISWNDLRYDNVRLVSYQSTLDYHLKPGYTGVELQYGEVFVERTTDPANRAMYMDETFHYATTNDATIDNQKWDQGSRVGHWDAKHEFPAGGNIVYVGGDASWKDYEDMKLRYSYSTIPLKGVFW